MSLYQGALDELSLIFQRLNDVEVDKAVQKIANARRIVVVGCGRERLQIMGFAMRLFHMGLDVAVVGDMTTPHLETGDLLIATNGPGEVPTVLSLMETAKRAGAEIMVLTAQPNGTAARLADFCLLLPAQTMADDTLPKAQSILPMGSAFEGALFILFEIMVLKLKDVKGISFDDMRARHTNLE
ncbi:SIS domain-containing protein [Bartonella sp. HY329]|uniref:6-phospho-3-hexuloisomerase n=1 Tax=unclassified Bartonella TaxID=2645622 RepID=UPI0021C65787|nr:MULTISPECIES: 6-phospho-3-hexuloisomerase [unclassified Bartonella]UXM94037.1 SIS domain-containing protein [Bartonella sp. HY329]UXN08359.1 SIS domain-containing protein [Bartonella sp. HY328]